MDTEQARARAEKIFKKEERDRDGKTGMVEYETNAAAIRANMARLKALRLAKGARAESDRKRST